MQWSTLSIPLTMAALLTIVLGTYAWQRRKKHHGATYLALMLFGIAAWSIVYMIQLMSTTLEAKEYWERWSITTAAWLAPFWLLFIIQHVGLGHRLSPRTIALILLPASAATIIAQTNDWHHWMWSEFSIQSGGPFVAWSSAHAPLFWIHLAFSYSYIIGGSILYILQMLRWPSLFRRQSGLMLSAALLPFLGNVASILGWIPIPGLDPGPFAFTLSGVLIFTAMFRYRLLDLVPIAHRLVLENMQDGVIVLDTDEHVVDVNPSARKILGLENKEDLVGRPVQEWLQGDLLKRYHGQLPAHKEIALGRDRWVMVSVLHILDRRGNVRGRLIVLRDVTAQHKLEQLRDELTSMMVHDLRNPLSTIMGSLGMLSGELRNDLSPFALELVEMAQHAGERALSLVSAILDINRLEYGEMPVDLRPCELTELAHSVEDELKPQLLDKHLELQLQIPPDLPPVKADIGLLLRILANLIGNAIKFTPEGGEITLSAEREGEWVRVRVSDTGTGIPEEIRPRLFQKFVAGDQRGRGSGLGLAFCRLAVEAHGGRIIVENTSPEGTTIAFTLPIAEQEPAGKRPQPGEEHDSAED